MSDEENDIHSQCYECGEMYNVSNNSNCSIHCPVCCDIKCGKFCNVCQYRHIEYICQSKKCKNTKFGCDGEPHSCDYCGIILCTECEGYYSFRRCHSCCVNWCQYSGLYSPSYQCTKIPFGRNHWH